MSEKQHISQWNKCRDFADSFFSPDTRIFMRALMLGDKTDFYRDLPLYAAMRGSTYLDETEGQK